MFSETVLKFYGQEKKKAAFASHNSGYRFSCEMFIYWWSHYGFLWIVFLFYFLSLEKANILVPVFFYYKYLACAKLKQRLHISKELDKYSQVDPNGNAVVWAFGYKCLLIL